MGRAAGILGAILAAAGFAGGGPEIVTARLEWEPEALGEVDSDLLDFEKKLPPGLGPPVEARAPLYARLPLGPGDPVAIAITVAPEAPRLWIDRDLDGDLSRETPSPLAVDGNWLERRETVVARIPGEPAPVPVEIRFSLKSSSPAGVWRSTRVHRRGEVVLGGMLRKVALRDESESLRFDGTGKPSLLLDVDGDGVLEERKGSHEWIQPGKPFRVHDEGWTFRVPSPSGAAVEFTRLPEAPPEAPRRWVAEDRPSRWEKPTPPARTMDELTRAYQALRRDPEYDAVTPILREAGQHGTEEAFAFLKSVAERAPTPTVRGYAVWFMSNPAFLAKHGDTIAAFSRHPNSDIATSALHALYVSGNLGLEKICIELLASTESTVAADAALHLGYLESETSLRAASDAVTGHRLYSVREKAYEGLRTRTEGPPAEVMAAAARGDSIPLRIVALRDLFRGGSAGTRSLALESAEYASRTTSPRWPAFKSEDLRALAELLASFPDGECAVAVLDIAGRVDAEVRPRVVSRLARLRSREVVDRLLVEIRSRDDLRRELAARALAGIRDSRASPELLKQLQRERVPAVAAALVEALGEQRDPAAIGVLLQAARSQGAVHAAAVHALSLLGLGAPEAGKFLVDLLDAKAAEDRIAALGAVAASPDPSLLPKVVPSLPHDAWQVRSAAVEALRRIRTRECVPPLVARLGAEDSRRVRAAIGDALFEITGELFGDDAVLWQRWWKEKGGTFVIPAEVPRRVADDRGGTVAGFFGIPLDSDRVVFVLDRSGSMDGADVEAKPGEARAPTRLERALRETLTAADRLGSGARTNVVLFETEVTAWKERAIPMTPAARKDLGDFLRKQKPGAATNLYGGLEKALADPGVDTLVLLSDGYPNEGTWTSADDILDAVGRLNATRRIRIHCVAFGYESDLLRRLAKENSGIYVRR
jgi:HEAT repeat protein